VANNAVQSHTMICMSYEGYSRNTWLRTWLF